MKITTPHPIYCVRGFALIATILIMVLLAMVVLGMLSLGSLEARSAYHDAHTQAARANARMALMIALGEIQKQLGDDRRITVPATQWETNKDSSDSSSLAHPQWIAAYHARSTQDELENSLPNDYYDRETNFLTWLVSHSSPSALESPDFIQSGTFSKAALLGSGMQAGKIPVAAMQGDGSYAWGVVSDESQRARLPQWSVPKVNNDLASVMMKSGLAGEQGYSSHPDLAVLKDDETLLNAYITHRQSDLSVPNDKKGELAAQLTPYSLSLLTDVKRGGFRKCLNMLLELDESELPEAFRKMETYTPISAYGGSRPLNGRKLSDAVLSGVSTDYDTLPVSLLHQYYKISQLGKITPTPNTNDGSHLEILATQRPFHRVIGMDTDIQADRYWRGYGHTLRLVPVIVRTRDIVWAMSRKVTQTDYELVFISFPVVTVWNPYNIDVQIDRAWVQQRNRHSTVANVTLGSFQHNKIPVGNRTTTMLYGRGAGNAPIVFSPGETKVLFPDFPKSWGSSVRMTNKWPANHSLLWKMVTNASTGVRGKGSDQVKIKLLLNNRSVVGAGSETHYNDGWFGHHGQWRGTKFHNWNLNIKEHIDEGIIGENSVFLEKSMASMHNRPVPIAIVNFGLKSMDHAEQAGTAFLFDYPQRMNLTPHYPLANKDLRGGFEASPIAIEFTPLRGDADLARHMNTLEDHQGLHDYLGYSYSPTRGSSYLTMCEVPMVPPRSLGQLQHLPLQDERWTAWESMPYSPTWAFGIGNSWAHPWIASNQLLQDREITSKAFFPAQTKYIPIIDRLWVANSLLYDTYTFTTIAAQDNHWFQKSGKTRGFKSVVEDFFSGTTPLPNSRLIPWPDKRTNQQRIDTLVRGNSPTPEAYRKVASELGIMGGFNINSTSVDAWKIILSSMFKTQLPNHPANRGEPLGLGQKSDRHIISRYSIPTGRSIDRGGNPYTDGFSGYREITTEQIGELAEEIVKEVKQRGPFRSLAEFVNRRRTNFSSDEKALRGVIQAALESPEVSINDIYDKEFFDGGDFPNVKFSNAGAIKGHKARGMPGFVSQADVLTPLAPLIVARGDTFTIRAYGESLDGKGNIRAQVWCEAVVQRSPDFIDLRDEKTTEISDLKSTVNKVFGRRFYIISFRWLSKDELNVQTT